MKLTIVGVAVLALLACLAAPAAAQKLSPAERVCAQTYLDKGVAASAPNPSVCTGGTITAYITDEGVPKVIEGKGTAFAEKIGLPGSCGIIVFYPGSFRPEDDSPDPPPPYAVTNFCSPNGLAHAYYNGLHEGLHTYCPDGPDANDCEELAVTLAATAAGCKTVGDLLSCLNEVEPCSAEALAGLLAEFPDLGDGNGGLDPGKVNEFAKGLCTAMKNDKEDVDPEQALACACGPWNSNAGPKCQVPTLPPNPDGSSGCDDDPPTQPTGPGAANWPIPACAACDSLAQ